MNEREEAYQAIVSDIKETEKLTESEIKAEIAYSHDDQLEMFKKGLEKEISLYYESELNDLKKLQAMKVSQAKLTMKKQLLQKRQLIAVNLFEEVLKKLNGFVQSDAYQTYLETNLSNVTISDSTVFYIHKNDFSFFEEWLKKHSYDLPLYVGDIAVGGFKLRDVKRHIEIDMTLDSKLEEAKKWFQNTSELVF